MPPKPGEKKRTPVSSSEEEKSTHVLVDDAILKDLQAKLDIYINLERFIFTPTFEVKKLLALNTSLLFE